jgi:hypothetical protein
MIPAAWQNMLYIAADTVRERTVFELWEFQPSLVSRDFKTGEFLLGTYQLGQHVQMDN